MFASAPQGGPHRGLAHWRRIAAAEPGLEGSVFLGLGFVGGEEDVVVFGRRSISRFRSSKLYSFSDCLILLRTGRPGTGPLSC